MTIRMHWYDTNFKAIVKVNNILQYNYKNCAIMVSYKIYCTNMDDIFLKPEKLLECNELHELSHLPSDMSEL